MAVTDDNITATSELAVTNGNGGPVFADIIPAGNKAYIMGKVGIGALNPVNTLDVEGAMAVGASYSGSFSAPANGLIVQGSIGVGTSTPGAKLDVAGTLAVSQDAYLATSSGFVGVGTSTPTAKLEVTGAMKVSQNAYLATTSGGVGIGTVSPVTKLEVAGDLKVSKDVYLATSSGSVGIGTASPLAKLQVLGGAIMPSFGNSTTAGIAFPPNPGGGAGDAAWMRYYVRAGESTTLEIGISNDADDHIALMASGNVGIGTLAPVNKLDVIGDVALQGKHALRGSDTWLRLNQDGAFTSGVHTPSNFAPASLNVGGVGNWGNPGWGNAWIAGTLTIGSNPVRFTSAWSGFPDATTNQAEISNDTGAFKTLMIVGNRSAGMGRRVSIWDRLEVNGDAVISGRLGTSGWSPAPRTPGWGGGIHTWDIEAEGTVWSCHGYQSGARDLAENYLSEQGLEPGDIVCIDSEKDNIVKACRPNDPMVLGVISAEPGFLLNVDRDGVQGGRHFPVALCGRVPCKVVSESGPIGKGDLLTSSSTAGHAMRAKPIEVDGRVIYQPGTIIGKALEAFDGNSGTIEIFVFSS